jgi:hypothetical protein
MVVTVSDDERMGDKTKTGQLSSKSVLLYVNVIAMN